MDSLVLSRVPWDVLAALAVIVVGILFIVFSLGMMLGERRAAQQAAPAPSWRDGGGRGSHGRGRRDRVKSAGDPARFEDAVGEATRAIEEAAARAIQDLEERAAAAARLLDEAEDRIEQLKGAVAALEREAQQGSRSGSQSEEGAWPSPGTCGMTSAPLDDQGARQLASQPDMGVAGTSPGVAEAVTLEPAAGAGRAAGGERDASAAPEAACARVKQAGADQALTGGPRVSGKHALVLSLADQGLTLSEIARQAGIGRGEAQLILELYGKQCLTSLSGVCAASRDGQSH
ncbi:MAG TPA: DUF2802 domain-containing protein [Firmicutes bacterium]|nr:DUF2802 domain-containing protein [Bacillota bacterium]